MTDEISALIVTRRPAKEMADGTLRVQFDVEPQDRRQFLNMFPDNGDPIAIAALDREAVIAHQQGRAFATPKPKGEHGKFAQWLVQSGFFRDPKVWKFCGSDSLFLEWLKTQECAVRRDGGCAGDVVPAHVRRVATGAGTGIKPEYSAIPLCDKHHSAQHSQGESAIGGKDFCDRERIMQLEAWSRQQFKTIAGLASLSMLSPQHFEATLRGSKINCNIPARFF